MKIYTRTGDRGTTSIVGGERLSKDAPRIEAYGTIDELNSHLGLLLALATDLAPERRQLVQEIQSRLLDIGGYLAGTATSGITEGDIAALEADIDAMQANLVPLRTFVLPGGTRAAAQAHVCRTVCRRAERRMVSLAPEPGALTYVNRLSDWLYTLALALNAAADTPETPWRPRPAGA